MGPLSLELIAYQKCNVDLENGNTDMIPLYLWYNYKHNFELFVFIINDVLQCLNKTKQLPKFKQIYNKIKAIFVSKRDRKYLENSLANFSNNPYFKCNFFEDLLLFDLQTVKPTFKKTNKVEIVDYWCPDTDTNGLFFNNDKSKIDYEEGEEVVCDTFRENFNKYTMNLFGDFNWQNCVVAGGLVNKIVNKDFEQRLLSGRYDNSDIDLYIYGTTPTKKRKLIYVLNFLKTKLGEYYLINKQNVITLIFPDYHCEIQIIIGNYKNPLQIINDFDLSHLQMLYNGKTVKSTKSNLVALETQTSRVMKNRLTQKLGQKTFMAGYALEYSNSISDEDAISLHHSIIGTKKIYDTYYKPTKSIFFENNKKKMKLYINKKSNICLAARLCNINRKDVYFVEILVDKEYIEKLNNNYNGNFTNSVNFYT